MPTCFACVYKPTDRYFVCVYSAGYLLVPQNFKLGTLTQIYQVQEGPYIHVQQNHLTVPS